MGLGGIGRLGFHGVGPRRLFRLEEILKNLAKLVRGLLGEDAGESRDARNSVRAQVSGAGDT
jgi:hypothetical protein